MHEGGISTPLIAHWPAGITAKNELRKQLGHVIDLMPTCVEISGAVYPSTYKEKAITPMEGLSLVPLFEGRSLNRDTLFWEHESKRAIRLGNWKLVAKGRGAEWELYNMAEDRSELNNLAAVHPERVEALAAKWQAYAERTLVLPAPPRPARPVKNGLKKNK